MNTMTAAQLWKAEIDKSFVDGSWDELIRAHSPVPAMELQTARERRDQDGWAWSALSAEWYGFKMYLFHPDHPYVYRFVEAGLNWARLALAEGPFYGAGVGLRNSPEAYKSAYLARANAKCEIAVAFGESFLHGAPIDSNVWRHAAEAYVAHSKTVPAGYRGQHDQSDYFFAVLCLLLAGDNTDAAKLVKAKKGFKAVANTRNVLFEISTCLESNGGFIPESHACRKSFARYFDAWRRPGKPNSEAFPDIADNTMAQPDFDMYRVCLAMLKEKYFERELGKFEWARILGHLVADNV